MGTLEIMYFSVFAYQKGQLGFNDRKVSRSYPRWRQSKGKVCGSSLQTELISSADGPHSCLSYKAASSLSPPRAHCPSQLPCLLP